MSEKTSEFSRRSLLAGVGAAAGAGILAPAALTSGAQAKAPMAGAAAATFRRVKLGGFEVTTLFDGFANVPKVHPIFGQNQTAETVADYMKANLLPSDKMQIGFSPVVVNTGGELVLFDTGNGSGRGPTRGKILAALADAGYSPEQVDVIIITHFHPDHIGGLMSDGKPVFANARIVTAAAEHNFWTSKDVLDSSDKTMQGRAKFVKDNVLPLNEKFSFVDDGKDVVTGITAVDASGHTPGHMAFNIESEGKRLLLWGDACNHYVASLQKPEWHVVFDMDKDKAVASRKKILDMAAADRVAVTGYHMPFPAMGFVEQVGDMHRWVPLTYQLDL